MITFNEDYLCEELAYVVENNLLLHAVNKQLSQKESVTVIYESKITDIKPPPVSESMELVSVQLQSGKCYRTRLLVSTRYKREITLGMKKLNANASSYPHLW